MESRRRTQALSALAGRLMAQTRRLVSNMQLLTTQTLTQICPCPWLQLAAPLQSSEKVEVPALQAALQRRERKLQSR